MRDELEALSKRIGFGKIVQFTREYSSWFWRNRTTFSKMLKLVQKEGYFLDSSSRGRLFSTL